MAGVMEASPWRVRHLRQQAAKRRDKEQIHSLQLKVQELELALWAWNAWVEFRAQRSMGAE